MSFFQVDGMMRYLYTFFLYLLTPFILCRLYWKGRRLKAYRHRILERFCLTTMASSPVDVWLHGVSLGEVVAAQPLIDALLAKNWRVLVTTMTPSGSEQVTRRYGDKVLHRYLPYDLPFAIRRFLNAFTPRLCIIMETELWPNVINQTYRQKIPLLLVNARLSDQSFKQYKAMTWMFKPVLNQFNIILAQSDEDAKRFIAVGASPDIVHMLGNMKFDLQLQMKQQDLAKPLKEKWGRARPVVIAASTHDDEEKQWLSHLSQLKAGISGVILLIAPRHRERFLAVYELSKSMGHKTGLRSQDDTIDEMTEVVVLDSLGELLHFYKASDYAFVGGSLVPIGGHNVLEPIAVDVPVFCGPFMNNSKAICNELGAAGAMILLQDVGALITKMTSMHHNQEERELQIKKASQVLVANRGTVARYMEKIEAILI